MSFKKPLKFRFPNAPRNLLIHLKKRRYKRRTGRSFLENFLPKHKYPEILLKKPKHNPILSPRPEYWWESWQVFNPGVILLDNKIHFLYRSIGNDGLSRFGYAVSSDGFNIDERLSYPVYSHSLLKNKKMKLFTMSGGSWGGCEDPRVVEVGEDDKLYITYTACDAGLRVALLNIKKDDFLSRRWRWSEPKFISPQGEIHKNWVIFPEKINGYYAVLHSISPTIQIEYLEDLEFDTQDHIKSYYANDDTRVDCWDSWVRGVGAPPIKTEKGWLIFYHAMDRNNPKKYKVGFMLLDLTDPTKVLHRAKNPVLEPEEEYENNGFKAGVVYVSGAVVKDGTLLVYYGGSDSYVCVAYAKLDEFLGKLEEDKSPTLKRKVLKRKLS